MIIKNMIFIVYLTKTSYLCHINNKNCTMNKILTLAFAALTLFATACGKSNDENPKPQDDAKKALIGTWKIESVTVNETIQVLSDCDKKSYIVFSEKEMINYLYSDKKCNTPQEVTATYSVFGNIIRTITKNETSNENFSISGNKLILSHTEETNGEKRNFVMTYIKQ